MIHSIGMILIGVGIFLITVYTPYDDTDDKVKKERSDMKLYTDYGTGCQYLRVGWFTGVTPRLDENGKPICKKIVSKQPGKEQP